MHFLLKISDVIDWFTHRLGKLVGWLVLAAVLISAGNAIMRKAFNIGSNAYLEVQWYLFAAVFMLGAAYVFLHNAHVRIDFIASRLSKRTNAIIDCDRHRRLPDPAVPDPDRSVLAVLHARLPVGRDERERRRADPLAGDPADPGRIRASCCCRPCPS